METSCAKLRVMEFVWTADPVLELEELCCRTPFFSSALCMAVDVLGDEVMPAWWNERGPRMRGSGSPSWYSKARSCSRVEREVSWGPPARLGTALVMKRVKLNFFSPDGVLYILAIVVVVN